MQNAALQYLGLDLIYIAIPCKDEDLELVLNSLKKINCKGLNITIPHKEKVFNLCSEISPIANKLKAINTLKLNSEIKDIDHFGFDDIEVQNYQHHPHISAPISI